MYLLYSLLLTVAALVGSPYWIYKAIRDKKYIRNFRQRLGLKLPLLPDGTRPVWVHCVSVGEVLAAKPLVSSIHKARPALPVVCSTVTLTGQALAEKDRATRLGTALVEMGAIDARTLRRAIEEQIKEVVYEIVRWREGRFRFTSGRRPNAQDVFIDIPLDHLILEGLKRLDEEGAVR